MVTNSTLATICVLTGLHDYVQHSSPDLSRNIAMYAETIRRIRDEEDKQSKAEGRVPIQFWAEVEAPKVRIAVQTAYLSRTVV